jgi:P4 family phage/plasmid primase-like protien
MSKFDRENAEAAVRVLSQGQQRTWEVRVPKAGRFKTISGYFNNVDALVDTLEALSNEGHEGVYYTLNPVNPALLARANNTTKNYAQQTSKDPDVSQRQWMLIDIDPVRPAGISSSKGEKAAAKARVIAVRDWLTAQGWPQPVICDSGNGYHLLYRIDLPNDDVSRDLVKVCLEALAAKFDTPAVHVDKTVYNASRIVKAYETVARKGDSTDERPHRTARMFQPPEKIEIVSLTQLAELSDLAPGAKKPANVAKGDGGWTPEMVGDLFVKFAEKQDFSFSGPTPEGNSLKWQHDCLNDEEHRKPDAFTFLENGYVHHHCSHNSCAGLKHKDWRVLWEETTGEKYPWPNKGTQVEIKGFDVEVADDDEKEAKVATNQTAGVDEPFNLTDIGNMERLVWRHGSKLKHAAALGWLVWDGTRWEQDETGRAERFAWNTVRMIPEEARLVKAVPSPENGDDPDGENAAESRRKAIRDWAFKSEMGGHAALMLKHTESAQGIAARVSEFDADLSLLNTKTGTIDLTTCEMQPHEREDMLTKIANVEYDTAAECPLWEKFVLEIMDGKRHMADFLQRALGYSLTGEISEHCILVLWGTGANGKSTFLEVVRHVMGDYAQAAEFGTFVAKKEIRTGPSSDIAKMRGARFVSATEGEQQHKLAESLVKQLTGGDTIAACFKFKEYFEFRPQFKLWLATNHKPIIGGTDDGIWRRIRLVPFIVSFADRDDKQLSEKLRREAPGILRWMVDGLKQWRLHGLMPPKEVLDATAQYRADEDLLMRFVADECEVGKGFETPARALYDRYKDWARRNHEAEVSERKFADGMKEHGWGKKATNTGRVYLGVKLAEMRIGTEMFEDESVL